MFLCRGLGGYVLLKVDQTSCSADDLLADMRKALEYSQTGERKENLLNTQGAALFFGTLLRSEKSKEYATCASQELADRSKSQKFTHEVVLGAQTLTALLRGSRLRCMSIHQNVSNRRHIFGRLTKAVSKPYMSNGTDG